MSNINILSSPEAISKAINPVTTATQLTPPIISQTDDNVVSLNEAENPVKGSPTTPIAATGKASNAATAIKKSNNTIKHACDSSTYVGKSVAEAGAFAGVLVREIRKATKTALEIQGTNPAASGIKSELLKISYYIKDFTVFIKQMTGYVQVFISYVNAIKQLLASILKLPVQLLKYFADCINTLKKQLIASFSAALTDTSVTEKDSVSLGNSIKQIEKSLGDFTKATATLATTTGKAVVSVTTLSQISSSNTKVQAEATQAVFSAAGFSDTKNNFAKA